MGEIQKNCTIVTSDLDQGHYFEALFKKAMEYSLITEASAKLVQTKLQDLLKKQIERYTSFQSSSVTIERAQSILASIYYTLGVALKGEELVEQQLSFLCSGEFELLMSRGQELIMEKIKESKRILKELQNEAVLFPNIAYKETLMKGIPVFFDYYDYKFAAHETPGSIDYPLSYDAMDTTGIEYIYEFLSHLSLENQCCKQFENIQLRQLLKGYWGNYKEDLFNVYELVLTNLLGKQLLQGQMKHAEMEQEVISQVEMDHEVISQRQMKQAKMDQEIINQAGINQEVINQDVLKQGEDILLTWEEIESLYLYFKDMEEKEFKKLLYQSFDSLASTLGIVEEGQHNYLIRAVEGIASRIKQGLMLGTLDKVFITIQVNKVDQEKKEFMNGPIMEDEKLRELIEEFKECEETTQKINLMKEYVTNLFDYVELVKECFFEEEYEEVFNLLNDTERQELISQRVPNEFGDYLM